MQPVLEKFFSENGDAGASKPSEHVYAIVRFDGIVESPEKSFTVKEIVRTQAIAESEVNRLNELNADKNCAYFWQVTRLFADGRSAGNRRSKTA